MKYSLYSFFILWLCVITNLQAQRTQVKGIVSDAETGEPIPFVIVRFEGAPKGVTTDFEGKYMLDTEQEYNRIKAYSSGYKTQSKAVVAHREQVINFKLAPETQELQEVTINSKKGRYRNKNNPAVALIRLVIDHKKQNRKESFAYYEYDQYEKVQFALSNITEKFRNRKAFKKFQFVFENMDTTKLEGKPVLPVYPKK
jgi:hypothetical protein